MVVKLPGELSGVKRRSYRREAVVKGGDRKDHRLTIDCLTVLTIASQLLHAARFMPQLHARRYTWQLHAAFSTPQYPGFLI